MTYRDTLEYLSSFNKMGIRLGLDPIRCLLERLHNPQNSFPAVLIAGTNGKGSVAAMTAAILSAGGFKTGLYTSPDLIDFRERIRINGRMISRREVESCVRGVKGQIR
ncbi:MAG: bifunctional folylpolyglutamate synthase/dihydrofolate synthase, partial [Proteobacteria bacterium]|nr:bifunctional folylpolyglutamate synthase/dihydrofolate synthase [Pseudomonadota bacterium]